MPIGIICPTLSLFTFLISHQHHGRKRSCSIDSWSCLAACFKQELQTIFCPVVTSLITMCACVCAHISFLFAWCTYMDIIVTKLWHITLILCKMYATNNCTEIWPVRKHIHMFLDMYLLIKYCYWRPGRGAGWKLLFLYMSTLLSPILFLFVYEILIQFPLTTIFFIREKSHLLLYCLSLHIFVKVQVNEVHFA